MRTETVDFNLGVVAVHLFRSTSLEYIEKKYINNIDKEKKARNSHTKEVSPNQMDEFIAEKSQLFRYYV